MLWPLTGSLNCRTAKSWKGPFKIIVGESNSQLLGSAAGSPQPLMLSLQRGALAWLLHVNSLAMDSQFMSVSKGTWAIQSLRRLCFYDFGVPPWRVEVEWMRHTWNKACVRKRSVWVPLKVGGYYSHTCIGCASSFSTEKCASLSGLRVVLCWTSLLYKVLPLF